MLLRLLVIVAFALGSCGGSGGGGDEATTPGSKRRARNSGSSPERTREYQDSNSVGMTDTRVSKWRWKGDRKDCFYIVGNKCFDDKTKACKAAGCAVASCQLSKSAPVKARCKK